MVQTEEQYVLIHDALLEAITDGITEVRAGNLYSYLQNITVPRASDKVTGLELEFKVSKPLFLIGYKH